MMAASILPAILVFILIFMESQITAYDLCSLFDLKGIDKVLIRY